MTLAPLFPENDVLITLRRLCAVERAIAYLQVPWSQPERESRVAFLAACELIAKREDLPEVFAVAIDDDSPLVESWLLGLGLAGLHAQGTGAAIWLAHGKVLWHTPSLANLGAKGVVDKSVALYAAAQQAG